MLKTRSQVGMIAFVAAFALLFINLFTPYSLPASGSMGTTKFMYLVWSIVLVSFALVIFFLSRTTMVLWTKHHAIKNISYIVWIVLEIIVIAVIAAVLIWSDIKCLLLNGRRYAERAGEPTLSSTMLEKYMNRKNHQLHDVQDFTSVKT